VADASGNHPSAAAGRDVFQAGRDLHVHFAVQDLRALQRPETDAAGKGLTGSIEVFANAAKSVISLSDLISVLHRMVQIMSSRVDNLAVERDALQADLRARADLTTELQETRASLRGTNERLAAAVSSQQELERRLSEAERKRTEAERLRAAAEEKLAQERVRLAEFEQRGPQPGEQGSSARAADEPGPIMGEADQQAVRMILEHADRLLREQEGNLRQWRETMGEPASKRETSSTATASVPDSVPADGRLVTPATIPDTSHQEKAEPPRPVKRPWWQRATALVAVSTHGVITGFDFVPEAAATVTSPTSVPVHLLTLERATRPGGHGDATVGVDGAGPATNDAKLRAAIVNVAGYYLRLAKTRTHAQVEALIWGDTSGDNADYGSSDVAFAKLTLELAAQATGLRSWAAGAATYPWPLPTWADVRVDPNPASPASAPMVADAREHERWHPLGDGYQPQPGDWALYDEHVAVVTSYARGALDTIGADSRPDLTVRAHRSSAPLAEQGITGFIDNGNLEPASGSPSADPAATGQATAPVSPAPPTPAATKPTGKAWGQAITPMTGVSAAIPGLARAKLSPRQYTTLGTEAQQAFISMITPGALGAQQRYGVPAAVTIAQAIEESAWGQSGLAAQYHNLFGIKGSGPGGSVTLPTQEFEFGQWVTIDAQFRAYHNDAESIADHAELLATSGYYTRAMAHRAVPDAFANDLTGVYATDPNYGANLIALMKLYNLYQYSVSASRAQSITPTRTNGVGPTPAATSAATHPAPPGLRLISGSPAQHAPAATGRVADADVAATVVTQLKPDGRQVHEARPERLYEQQLPPRVHTAFFACAHTPIRRMEPMYKDIARQAGISWELLAACDWMQCQSKLDLSPVHGERLGRLNADGTSYTTKSAALTHCARDFTDLSALVYGIDLTARRALSVWELAAAFAAFRWAGILRRHGVSPMEFPYSVAGLTALHQKMHWPDIDAPEAPDRPGARFREPFGAVPVVLRLGYPAAV
jgi:flagellum-specific peptidoglycan hydrolase FlgJ